MNKYRKILGTTFIILPCMSYAAEINISIVGTGSINAVEAETSCEVDCVIENDLETNTLQAVGSASNQFLGWSGQQCDAGGEVIFEESSTQFRSVADGAKTLADGDINNDGKTDLAYISLFNGQVGIYRNNGDASYSNVIVDESLNYPSALALYDWDNDGDEDLLVVEYSKSQIILYTNDGSGEFEQDKLLTIPGIKPYAISITDINNDNLPDLAISSFFSDVNGNLSTLVSSIRNGKTAWYSNLGNDTFEEFAAVSDIAAITMSVNVPKDNNTIELVTAEIESGDISLYSLANNSITKKVIHNGEAAYGVAFGDIDDNGTVDVLSSHYRPSKLDIIYRDHNGNFGAAQNIGDFHDGVTATAISDINDDGYKDAVTAIFNDDIFYYWQTKSYKDCIINTDAKINVTANFSNTAPTTPATVDSNTSSSSKSSGGVFSLSILVLALIRLFSFYRKGH